jgi:hypothetical protein
MDFILPHVTLHIPVLTGGYIDCTFRFIGEETFAAGEKPSFTDEPTWIVDPIGSVLYILRITVYITRAI